MMESSKTKSNSASILPKTLQRSISPPGRFCSSSSSAFASSISSFSSPSRSPANRINVLSPSPVVRFPINHYTASSGCSVTSSSSTERKQSKKRTCMCSPTTHPGSFRCSLHKSVNNRNFNRSNNTVSYHSHRLYARRSAMTNSLVRIGTVEGDLVKRALASLIRPSSHQQRRRGDFQPRPSRLSVVSMAGD